MAREINLTCFAGLQRYANLEKFIHLAEQFAGARRAKLAGISGLAGMPQHKNEAEAPVDSRRPIPSR